MVQTQERWRAAQEYERGYWLRQANGIADGAISQLGFYQWRADQLVDRLKVLGHEDLATGSANILEVGCGPVGVGSRFPANERLLVDPLASAYAANEILCELRNPDAEYREGVGESLPAESGHYDLVLIENCIDHVHDADAVMRELLRVVKPTGLVYLTVNNRCALGYWVHRFLSRTRIDSGHPYTFTPGRFRRLLERHGLRVEGWEVGSFWEAWREDLSSTSAKAKLKALLGVSEFVVSAIASVDRPGAQG